MSSVIIQEKRRFIDAVKNVLTAAISCPYDMPALAVKIRNGVVGFSEEEIVEMAQEISSKYLLNILIGEKLSGEQVESKINKYIARLREFGTKRIVESANVVIGTNNAVAATATVTMHNVVIGYPPCPESCFDDILPTWPCPTCRAHGYPLDLRKLYAAYVKIKTDNVEVRRKFDDAEKERSNLASTREIYRRTALNCAVRVKEDAANILHNLRLLEKQ